MARQLRVEYPGAIYHVMNRGDRREPIFRDDADRLRFLELVGEVCAMTHWWAHAYSLMLNHFHLVIETPQANLVAGMQWFLGTYTSQFNRKHKLVGHVFSGRYKALVVDGSQTGYLKTVCDYVHLNPTRAHLLAEGAMLSSYPWSSMKYYLVAPRRRPGWLRVDRLLGEHGIPRDSAAGRREFERRMELRQKSENAKDEFVAVRRGWCLGDQAFRKELLAMINEKRGAWHYGEELEESAQETAEKLIERELRRAGWTEQKLRTSLKGDPFKIGLASRLRAQTTMTVRWIADRLQMGSRGHLTHLLYWHRRRKIARN